MSIRVATAADADACAAIYAPYVRDSAITFETEPPSAAEFADRIAAATATHAWLVLDDGEHGVGGYAYGGPMKTRAAYRWACEVSVYLDAGQQGRGEGRRLYEAMFARLAERGYRVAVAGMTLPNPSSEGLHRALGFEPVGVFRGVGWKLDGWHDVAWMQRSLSVHPGDGPPAEPH